MRVTGIRIWVLSHILSTLLDRGLVGLNIAYRMVSCWLLFMDLIDMFFAEDRSHLGAG